MDGAHGDDLRGVIPAAPLKRFRIPSFNEDVPSPRGNSRGPIEAYDHEIRETFIHIGLRGVIPAAPLKPAEHPGIARFGELLRGVIPAAPLKQSGRFSAAVAELLSAG